MKAYLVDNEINELKRLRDERINYSDLSILKKYLEKNGKPFELKSYKNSNNVYDILFAKNQGSILNSKLYLDYREQHPAINTSNWKVFIFEMYLSQLDPDGFIIYNLATSINLEYNRGLIEDSLKQIGIENFDIDGFLLNKDFDFTPYTIKELDKKEYESIADAAQNILNIFDGVTKNLSDQDKELFKNNFFQVFEYVIKNVGKNDLKTKDNVFRNLLNYINEKRTKK